MSRAHVAVEPSTLPAMSSAAAARSASFSSSSSSATKSALARSTVSGVLRSSDATCSRCPRPRGPAGLGATRRGRPAWRPSRRGRRSLAHVGAADREVEPPRRRAPPPPRAAPSARDHAPRAGAPRARARARFLPRADEHEVLRVGEAGRRGRARSTAAGTADECSRPRRP